MCRRDYSVLIWNNIFAANHVGHEAEIPRLRHRPPSGNGLLAHDQASVPCPRESVRHVFSRQIWHEHASCHRLLCHRMVSLL